MKKIITLLCLVCLFFSDALWATITTTHSPALAKMPETQIHNIQSGTYIQYIHSNRTTSYKQNNYNRYSGNDWNKRVAQATNTATMKIYSTANADSRSSQIANTSNHSCTTGSVSKSTTVYSAAISSIGTASTSVKSMATTDTRNYSNAYSQYKSSFASNVSGKGVRLAPPGMNNAYQNWLDNLVGEYGTDAYAYTNADGTIYYYSEATLKQWFLSNFETNDGHDPNEEDWESFLSWFTGTYANVDGAHHFLPIDNDFLPFLLCAVICALYNMRTIHNDKGKSQC